MRKKRRSDIGKVRPSAPADPIPADVREIVGDADADERAWIADRLAEMARRIRATVPVGKSKRRFTELELRGPEDRFPH